MNAAAIIEAVQTAISVASALVSLGKDVKPLFDEAASLLSKGGDATQEDIDALIAMSDAWSDELDTPIDEPQPGDA